MPDQAFDDFLNDAFKNANIGVNWNAPASDPLTDIYNAMQSMSDEMVLRQPNREGVYVITTLQPRSNNGD